VNTADPLRAEALRVRALGVQSHTSVAFAEVRGWTPIGSGESGARVFRSGDRIAKVGGDLDGERAWPSLLDMLARIHALPAEGCPFERRLATMFALAEQVVAEDRVEPAFLSDAQRRRPPAAVLEGEELDLRPAQEPGDLAVCHGDPCLPNSMVEGDTCTGVIDRGRLGVADRHADLALPAANSGRPVAGDAERLRFYLALDPLTWRRA
jgi:aminoglycoside phosphotransferase